MPSQDQNTIWALLKKDCELPVGYVSMGYVLGNYRFGGEVADVPPFAFESKKGH
jgi:hypothetical protein